jgi:hypothetical protein
LRHPVARLYGEYLLGYLTAIRSAPLTTAERNQCYRYLMRWLAGRAVPVFSRSLRGGALQARRLEPRPHPDIQVDALVAGREGHR